MDKLMPLTITGLATGCIYALAASGLVVTYTTSGIFNFAHGAIGMVMAFLYWELHINQGIPTIPALILVLLVIAPLFGALIERLLMRQLYGSSAGTSIVVTLGLLLTLIGLASTKWSPATARTLPYLFGNDHFRLFGVNVYFHTAIVVLATIGVALFLRFLFYSTRIGIAMRAVVDDPELAALNGATPARVAQLSWALGASLAGLAGVLLAPLVELDVLTLTLLVINGFAAAVVGRLKNLPMTFAGAIGLGLLENYAVGYLSGGTGFIGKHMKFLSNAKPAMPTIFLFVALLVLPQVRLRVGRVVSAGVPKVPTLRQSIIAAGAFVAIALALSGSLSQFMLAHASLGLVLGLIMLSLVLLTGYGGQVSLCQLTFVGLGAFAMGKVAGGGGSPLGLLVAVLLAAPIGALVALPALRLQGLYLALITFAFAQGMDKIFFSNEHVFGFGGSLHVGHPLGVKGGSAYFVLLAALFAFTGVGVLAVRRGPFGRRLAAMGDSPSACSTLGLNLTVTKLIVFTVSAALAGLAGAFYGGLRGAVGANDFLALQSLVLMLLATIGGINTVSGALLGGMTYGLLLPVLQNVLPSSIGQFTFLGTGLAAISLGRNPNGMASQLFSFVDRVRVRARTRPRGFVPPGDLSLPQEVDLVTTPG
jgi:branched-chain amino acid transport system permease protein